MTKLTGMTQLKGEGEARLIRKTRERVPCMECGEPADQRHTYLLPDARHNPQSSGYRGDDISRCSDADCFTCKACRDQHWRGRQPPMDGYEWCGTYTAGDTYAHMFLRWREDEIKESDAA